VNGLIGKCLYSMKGKTNIFELVTPAINRYFIVFQYTIPTNLIKLKTKALLGVTMLPEFFNYGDCIEIQQ
jgi:hypothetical protein